MEKWLEFLDEHSKKLIKGLLGTVLLLAFSLIYLLFRQPVEEKESEAVFFTEFDAENQHEKEDILNNPPETIPDVENKIIQEADQVFVDIKGAVYSPGVYEMEKGTRVIDCIEQAGGLLAEAEQKSINLAQCLEDQMVIYVPLQGEEIDDIVPITSNSLEVEANSVDSLKINLNQATKEELKSLSGIGDVKAENIISYRETNGNFQTIDEIKNVSGIGEATFDKIKEELWVSP